MSFFGYTILILLMLGTLLIGCTLFGKRKKFSPKQLSFSSMAIALAVITSLLTLLPMPMGGSVTLCSMFFITLIGSCYGLGVGITTGIAYGILQLILNPYIISLPQMLLDYLFAFGALGLSGLFAHTKNGIRKGYLLGVFGRFLFASLSGYLFFPMFMPEFFDSPLLYSICYNGAYIGAEAAFTLILISLPPVHKALHRIKNTA